MRSLLIGAGSRRDKLVAPTGDREWHDLTTLDINGDHRPNVVHDLEVLPLPFADDSFDEIHAYEVLEHTGQQGDYRFFFAQFSDFWRILKPGGFLCGSTPLPTSVWAWGDPSHRRVIPKESFVFLDQQEYVRQIGVTAMSDFRWIYEADFTLHYAADFGASLYFALRAVKPSRVVRPT